MLSRIVSGDIHCPTKIEKVVKLSASIICKALPIGLDICTAGVFTLTTALALYFTPMADTKLSNDKLSYQPITPNSEETQSFYKVPTALKMVGESNQNNFMVADKNGSHIWSKNLGFVVLGDGPDNIYYSLCSTAIIDGIVGVVKNFNQEQDKIHFFCSLKSPTHDEIEIKHKEFNSESYTCIEVREQTAVCLLGDINLTSQDIGRAKY